MVAQDNGYGYSLGQDSKIGSRTMGLWTTDWETTKWKTAKVGGVCLFEKPRSRVGKIPRFSSIASGDDHYCNDNANCDSGA